MSRNSHRRQPFGSTSRARLMVLGCTLFFVVLATLPSILPALHIQLSPTPPRTSHGVTLMRAPQHPRAVQVPAVARGTDPDKAFTRLPPAGTAREAGTVVFEDNRIRTLLHMMAHITKPTVVSTGNARPTLVLPGSRTPYTAQTLADHGALTLFPHGTALLTDNVYVSGGATLSLGGPAVRMLRLESGRTGFATIVSWGGNLTFAGAAAHPMTITSWDQAKAAAAGDHGRGRSYIREVGGRMALSEVRASALGFWSGRTGGVAWTGRADSPSTGLATDSTFTGDTYGAFVSRGSGVVFRADLFESNAVDGLHVHRYSTGTQVIESSAVRNGSSGFVVSPTAQYTTLTGDIAEHNGGNGFFLDGRPLATGASAAGGSVAPSAGTRITGSAALGNAGAGVLVEGGQTPVVAGNQVCDGVSGIVIKDNASNAVVTGNTVGCSPKSGLTVGPLAAGTVLAGNAVNGARIAILVRRSAGVQLFTNVVTGATVFGVSLRGRTTAVSGIGNILSGSGFRAVDASADSALPALKGTDTSGWSHHAPATFWAYLWFHPLAALWISIAGLLLLAFGVTRLRSKDRRRPAHPYPATTRWRPDGATAGRAATGPLALASTAARLVRLTMPQPKLREPAHQAMREPAHQARTLAAPAPWPAATVRRERESVPRADPQDNWNGVYRSWEYRDGDYQEGPFRYGN